ncbi:helix-turn-helix domain-containing protein [Kitasatospora sp. NPDC058201]|uniref:helix-turn-helix domain-containing protein n=1 Tax=unclassified Kitasatospora TaxID=2633591 RepID=UPI003655FC58
MSTTHDRPAGGAQTVRHAWTTTLRAEVLRVGSRDLAAVARVGVWLASYADADGGNAFPSRETLAALAGCSVETVTRALRVLTGAGMLRSRRRPNSTAVYTLVLPSRQPDWTSYLHHYTDTRQRRARATEKAESIAAAEAARQTRTASPDAVRTASPAGVPDSVPGGGSGQRPRTPSEGSDSVPGRPRTASPDAVRTASPAGPYRYLPTYGRDSIIDHPAREAEGQVPAVSGSAEDDDAAVSRLAAAMQTRGMRVSWLLSTDEREGLARQIAALGTDALVDYAARVWRSVSDPPFSARYFLAQWLTLRTGPVGPAADAAPPNKTSDYLADMAAIAEEMRQT